MEYRGSRHTLRLWRHRWSRLKKNKMKIKVKTKKLKCLRCGRTDGTIKFYLLTSRSMTPKPYHPKCIKK